MALTERLTFALIGLFFGVLLGAACWWLYGLAHSLNYDGPGMDPKLRHWITCSGAAFAALGFLFRDRVGEFVGDVIGAIFHFECDDTPGKHASPLLGCVFLAIIVAAIWFTVLA